MGYAHAIDVIGEGAAIYIIYIVGEIGAADACFLGDITDFEVLFEEVTLGGEHAQQVFSYLILLQFGQFHGQFEGVGGVDEVLLHGEFSGETDVTEHEEHDGERHQYEQYEPFALRKEMLSDGIGGGRAEGCDEESSEEMLHGGGVAALHVGVYLHQFAVEILQALVAEIDHAEHLHGEENLACRVRLMSREEKLSQDHQYYGRNDYHFAQKGEAGGREQTDVNVVERIDRQ